MSAQTHPESGQIAQGQIAPIHTDPAYNFAYLDEETKRMIRRALLKGLAVPGYQVPFASR